MKTPLHLFALGAACLLAAPVFAQTTPVFSENFESLTAGTAITWGRSSTSMTFAATDDAGLGNSGNTAARFQASWGADHRHSTYVTFGPVSLALGESLTLSFTYQATGAIAAASNNRLLFGLSNTHGSTDTTQHTGYFGAILMDSRAASGHTANYAFTGLGSGNYTTGLTGLAADSTSGTSFYLTAANQDNVFQFTYTIARIETGLEITTIYTDTTTSASFSRTSLVAIESTDTDAFTFDALNLGMQRRVNTTFTVDDILVVYSQIPEPSAVAGLAGAGVLFGTLLLRRPRR